MRFILDAHHFVMSFSFGEINWRAPKTYLVIGAVALVLYLLISWIIPDTQEAAPLPERMREVKLASVGGLTSDTEALPVIGEVTSAKEADIRAEAGGRVTGVYVRLGDRVGAGHILAETENSAQRAAVLQAEGAYDAAKAALDKVQGGTRGEQLAILESSLDSARGGAVATLLSAYGAVDSAVKDTADDMFSGVELGQPNFSILTASQQLELDAERRRADLTAVLNRQTIVSRSLTSSSDLTVELVRTEHEIQNARTFTDVLLKALAEAIVSGDTSTNEITAFKASATAARAALTASLSGVIAARNALEVAQKNLEQGVAGAQSEDIAASTAAVKQAQGAYNAALSALEKTRIRTPISGSVNSLSIQTGDFVSGQAAVAIVSNNSALEIVTYVTEEDRPHIVPGKTALIEGTTRGVVTRVAPALDPVTRKVEVRIGIPAGVSTLSNGQSVRLDIERAADATTLANELLSIPISAVKIEAARTIVFTVGDNDALFAHAVVLGPLLGDKVQILDGLTPEMIIVTDARGLKEGETVAVTSHAR